MFSQILTYLPKMASGVSVTILLMIGSLSVGFVLALLLTIGSMQENRIVRKLINLFIFFIRGTPLLVQIFLIYYGAGQFEWIRNSLFWIVLRDPMGCSIIALAINSACYTSILLQGAIKSVPKSEVAACEALGMSKWLALRRVIFPRAFRIALPAYSNEVIMILKGTSLASTITLLDIMGVTQQMIAQTYQTVELYILAGIIYLILNGMISLIFRMVMKWNSIPEQAKSFGL